MDSETLVYFMSIGLILLVICTVVALAVAYGAIDILTDYYGWLLPGF